MDYVVSTTHRFDEAILAGVIALWVVGTIPIAAIERSRTRGELLPIATNRNRPNQAAREHPGFPTSLI
jgi:hypothetical protein